MCVSRSVPAGAVPRGPSSPVRATGYASAPAAARRAAVFSHTWVPVNMPGTRMKAVMVSPPYARARTGPVARPRSPVR
jgi:hypothetical protein